MRWLTDPYAYDFMRRALLASLIVGAVAPLVGTWMVLRRLAYLSDAMSHATVGGVAIAYLGGTSITLGALGAGLTMAALMSALASHPRLREDAVIGSVGAALFAAGVVIISHDHGVAVDLTHLLFGSVTTVSGDDLRLDAILGGACALIVLALFRDLRAATFDPEHAALVGVRTGVVRHALYALLAICVVLGLQSVGLLMSVALFVIPPAAARLWARTAAQMTALSSAFGVAAAVAGLTVSYHADSAPGATIALSAVAILAISFALTLPRRGGGPRASHPAPGNRFRPAAR